MAASYSTLISTTDLQTIINHPELRLFDCRFNLLDENKGLQDFNSGHIENSQYADLNRQLAGPVLGHTGRHPLPDKAEFENQLQLWGVDESSQIVVYDDACGAIAARLWWLCRWAGLEQTALLDGGLNDWIKRGNALSTAKVSFEKTNFNAYYNDQLWVSTREIEQTKDDSGTLITDARTAMRYNGESEPIDKRAGHVPGAVNFPFENNLGEDGLFLNQPALLRMHQQDPEISNVISMCGSGVTACHNILARTHAGLDSGQLYVGSWSEWITDPSRDINTGNV